MIQAVTDILNRLVQIGILVITFNEVFHFPFKCFLLFPVLIQIPVLQRAFSVP